ncbi:MAG: hypothetical protein J0I07_16660 [Myxococcales bacterium]|nr:hypothetical protein [Myxococcales bacterium]
MRVWTAFASLPLTCAIMMACSSEGGSSEPNGPEPDASTEPPVSPEAGSPDASDPDAGARDAGPLKPLDVVCADASTCYVGVSGNGSRHVCGLLQDRTVRCWGRDSLDPPVTADGGVSVGDGALGRGVAVSRLDGATPTTVVGLSDVTQVSVGPNFGTCARTSDGSVYCWGKNELGQLGRPRSEERLPTPTRVEGIPPVDHVELGSSLGCAIGSSDRALYCWGWWRSGLGIPEDFASPSFAPQLVTTFRAPVKALAIGSYGPTTLYPWGYAELADTIVALLDGNVVATLGKNVLRGDSAYPTSGPSERSGIDWIGAFAYATSDGFFRRWLPAEETVYIPAFAPAIELKVSADTEAVTALQGGVVTTTGRLFRWGPNPAGALGVGPSELSRTPYPVEVEQVRGRVVSFATTVGSTCALLVDGKVKCWGANVYGELGRGTTDLNAHPEPEVVR